MTRIRRSALATATSVALTVALAGPAASAPSAPAGLATKYAHALAAVRLFEKNGYAELGLPSRHALWVRACYRGVCAHDRLRPEPVCDPAAEVCLGSALRAIRVTSRLVVVATYF